MSSKMKPFLSPNETFLKIKERTNYNIKEKKQAPKLSVAGSD